MLLEVELWPFFEYREHVEDRDGRMICKGMYVISANSKRQGWVVDVEDSSGEGIGNIKVRIVREKDKNVDYITEFEPGTNWYRARTDAG